jgi:hypothetical protein
MAGIAPAGLAGQGPFPAAFVAMSGSTHGSHYSQFRGPRHSRLRLLPESDGGPERPEPVREKKQHKNFPNGGFITGRNRSRM